MILRLALLFAPFLECAQGTYEEPTVTFDQLYRFGKNAYSSGEWEDCIGFMKKALEDYEYYESELLFCSKKCLRDLAAPPKFEEAKDDDYERLASMHFLSERALCSTRCRRERFTKLRPTGSQRDTVHDFLERRPFNYLQICHWKNGDYAKAVASAYTYLVANPTDEEAMANMAFYMEKDAFADYLLEDKQRADYEREFISGVTAYDDEDYQKCVSHLETAVEEFWKEEAKCRISCRNRVDWAGIQSDSDVDSVIASMLRSVTACQHDCQRRLSWINGHDWGDVVAQTFRYAHFCYFKLMRGQDAARAVANAILLDPTPDIRWNRAHYAEQYPGRDDIFTPSTKVVEYARARALEKKYLYFFDDRFTYTNGEFKSEAVSDYAPLEDMSIDNVARDEFPYSRVSELLNEELCSALRQAALQLPSPYETAARAEAETRIQSIFPRAHLSGVVCGALRRPSCDRAIVLSIEGGSSCGSWLGTVHQGCALVACEK